ncbi:MAG: transketolase [Saprospiraceae bacterium]|nr:transketolase [Saprospiraceae bacterium]
MNYQELLTELANKDERLLVLTAENRALIRDLPGTLGERFIDVGIAEQTMIGMAAGLALRGRIPICHALASFLIFRAYEFIRNNVGIPGLPVKLSGYIPGFLSEANGPTHQALEDMSLMRGIPNMEVYCPADQGDMINMLHDVWTSDKPAYIRINTRTSEFEHSPFKRGEAEVISIGNDVNIISAGFLFEEAMKVKSMLEMQGISTGLTNIRSLKPMDEATLIKIAQKNSWIITMEDHFKTGGLYSAITEVYVRNRMKAKVLPFAMDDQWFRPSLLNEVLKFEGFTAEAIFNKIYKQINCLQYVQFN